MKAYILHTNEGQSYVQANEEILRKAMSHYIKVKKDKGLPLSAIIFCWMPIHFQSIPKGE